MHDLIIVGIPLLGILAGVLFNRNDARDLRDGIKDLRGEINGLRAEVNVRFNKVEDHLGRIAADLRQFYHLTGKLEARMDSIEKRD